MDERIQKAIDEVKAFNPKAIPTKVYSVSNGYLVVAPITLEETDYGDPFYFVKSDFKQVTRFSMKNRKDMFRAFTRGPLWERGKE